MERTILFMMLAMLPAMVSCGERQEDALRTGDLIFVGIPASYSLDSGSMSEAIGSATGGKDSLQIIHVAIAEVEGDRTWIIDATIKHGVDRHPLDTFLTDFTLRDGTLPVFLIKRLKDDSRAGQFVENAKAFLGQPYDVHFMPDNGRMYCTELVRDSYVTPGGTYIFSNAPMNFKSPDGTFPEYWQQLFGRLGVPIPQDVLGTNPHDLSASDALETVEVALRQKDAEDHPH